MVIQGPKMIFDDVRTSFGVENCYQPSVIRKPSRHSSVVDVVGAPHVEMERSSGICWDIKDIRSTSQVRIFKGSIYWGCQWLVWKCVKSWWAKTPLFVFLCKARFQGLHRGADSYDWLILRAASQTSFLWVVFRCIVTYMVSEQGFRDVRER